MTIKRKMILNWAIISFVILIIVGILVLDRVHNSIKNEVKDHLQKNNHLICQILISNHISENNYELLNKSNDKVKDYYKKMLEEEKISEMEFFQFSNEIIQTKKLLINFIHNKITLVSILNKNGDLIYSNFQMKIKGIFKKHDSKRDSLIEFSNTKDDSEVSMVGLYKTIPQLNIMVFSAGKKSEFFKEFYSISYILVLLLIIALTIMTFSTVFITKYISKPLGKFHKIFIS